ncbi:MAG: sugar ABC transporter permease [Caldilineaceae bacterium]
MAAVQTTTSMASRPPSRLARRAGLTSALRVREAVWGYIFLLPWVLGLLFFILGPIIASAYFSFTEYDVLTSPKFVGVQNYAKALFDDNLFWPSLGRTLRYALIVVPVGLTGSLLLAILLNRGLKGTNIYRTLFFLPSLTPAVALALLWTWLFHPSVGPINVALSWVGIHGPGWLSSKEWALPSIMIISLWAALGGNTMLIFLAGLQGVPQELYEAAEIDGAGAVAKFFNVTLPMISPTLLFNLILGVIGALKVFTLAFVATLGGPSYATWFYALHIYRQAFEYFRMGYGSALAWLFVVLLLFFTYLQLNWSRRWVYYAGEGE